MKLNFLPLTVILFGFSLQPAQAQVTRMTKQQIQAAGYNVAHVVCNARAGKAYYPNTDTVNENMDLALFKAGLNRNGTYSNADWDAIKENSDRFLNVMNSNCEVTAKITYSPPTQTLTINGIKVQCAKNISNCADVALPAVENWQKKLQQKYAYCQSIYRSSPDVNACVKSLDNL